MTMQQHPGNDLKILRIVATVFGLIGIVFTIIGILTFITTQKAVKTYEPTTAEITDFDRDGYPYVKYTVDGKEYEVRLNFSSSTMRTGQQMQIAYDPSDPYQVIESGAGAYLLPGIFGFIGIIFVIISVLLIRSLLRARKRQRNEGDIFSSSYNEGLHM